MTENGKELEELRRAHAALSRVETVLPTLATKADLEAMGTRFSNEMHHQLSEMREMLERRFGGIEHKCAETDKSIDKLQDKMDDSFKEMQREMQRGFIQVWTWLARSMLAIVLAIAGVIITILARSPAPAPGSVANPGIAYHFHEQSPALPPVAPPPQP